MRGKVNSKASRGEIRLGEMNRLKVVKRVDFGFYLDGGDMGNILLPAKEAAPDMKPGDEADVFLYLDQEERLVATTLRPKAAVGQFACLQVAWVNNFGAFLDWGLMKDLFVPFREQRRKMQRGEWHIVHVHLDDTSHRIVASAKVDKFLSTERPPYNNGDSVSLMVWQHTDIGYKVIIDGKYGGLLYQSQVFTSLHIGQVLDGYISCMREDGKVDCSLQPAGRQKIDDFTDILFDFIKDNGGSLAMGDKTPAEEIYATFGVSKKVFKQAVGALYKQHRIVITPEELQICK